MRTICLLLLLALPGLAERIPVPLRDPSRPATVKVSLVNGSIHVRTHAGPEVVVDSADQGARTRPAPNGMREIVGGMDQLHIEEEDNVVSVKPGPRNTELTILVPVTASLRLKSVNGKGLKIEGVGGEINAETVNGSIEISDASGPVVAHALNGRLTVGFKQLPAGKPMSFSTLNGRIDLTLPASAKAELKIRNQRGETYSDFDMQVSNVVTREESNRDKGPKYKLKMEKIVTAKVNGGGGPEINLRSLNGSIYIHKGQ